MEILLVSTMIAAAVYVGWNIGANDAANCIGTTVGAQIISYRKAALMMAVLEPVTSPAAWVYWVPAGTTNAAYGAAAPLAMVTVASANGA